MVEEAVPQTVLKLITEERDDWRPESMLCLDCLNDYRAKLVENLLKDAKGELDPLEQEVIDSIKQQDIISDNVIEEMEEQASFGERVADKVAEFGGSWKFIIMFTSFLLLWIAVNSVLLISGKSFDPYPFILLNLILSCIAAMQAPIIMMSQNRQSRKDRIKSDKDYQINLKAELQIRLISRRLDQFITQQWQKFVDIQQIQTDILASRHTSDKR